MNEILLMDFLSGTGAITDGSVAMYIRRTMNSYNMHMSTVNAAGQVTFVTRISDYYSQTRRTTSFTKFVRYLSQQCSQLVGVDVQKLQDELIKWAAQELADDRYTFEEVTGDDLVEAYRVGPHSCMRGRKAQAEMYRVNPERIALLKVLDRGVYVGRALIWTCDKGERHLDRVYPGNGRIAFVARQYATKQGWTFKGYDSIGATAQKDFEVTLKHVSNRRIPYLDTMSALVRCDADSFTLSSTGQDSTGLRYRGIGSYTGYSQMYHRSYKYLDGMPVVKTYRQSYAGGSMAFLVTEPVSFPVRVGRNIKYFVMRKDDELFYIVEDATIALPKAVVEIDGAYYLRTDVRKRRGLDEYLPKPDAVKRRVKERVEILGGGTVIHLEVDV